MMVIELFVIEANCSRKEARRYLGGLTPSSINSQINITLSERRGKVSSR